ncbi:helix-turn-helix domain-containing protein [Streptomyces zingiberis]|uniref:Helix-turn-helix transcriptional regulator n=1 Tax=Streptomyces zingiberis TaxID=2053010 RepID=A0ABX1BW49_9ACTN|nr:helix-turn-helix transcriptional regulator [Streptomyces zingiberis]NJQ00498.1 helix-turn-helix transcriptional regulator [Streptomyces zingiberis]
MSAADELDPTASVLAFFASELRRVRREAGVSQTDLARTAYVTPSLLSKIEAASRVPSQDLAEELDRSLGADGHFTRLWPLVIKHAYPPWFRPYVELERNATVIRTFQVQFVHGLLQTEDYARAVLSAGRPDAVEDLLTARLERQRLLDQDLPPRLWLVMDETVLRRVIGGPSVMHAQLAKLVRAAANPRNVIQVVPYSAGAHAGFGPFTLLSFAEGADVVHEDGFSRGQLLADPEDVQAAVRSYDLLRAVALSPDASIEMIIAAMKELSP